MDKLKIVIQRALPLMKLFAQMTANKYDDLVVSILEELLQDDVTLQVIAKRLEV